MYHYQHMKGSELCLNDQKRVLAQYVHRFTGDHKPVWAKYPRENGQPYPLQFRDDNDWLANTEFAVTKTGQLDKKAYFCTSLPTWPNNPELRGFKHPSQLSLNL